MASRSLNRIVLVGNLTRDPELKYTPAGTAVCTFGVATNRNWTTTDGQIKEETQFHRLVAWQKLAELCGKLLTKGRKVYCEGRMTYRTFVGKDGQQRTVAEIVLDDFIVFGDGKRAADVTEEKVEEKPVESNKTDESLSVDKVEMAPKEKSSKSSSAEASEDKEEKDEVENVNPDDIPF